MRTFLIFVMSLLASPNSRAGTNSSGGGASWVCRNAKGVITAARFFDLFEVENTDAKKGHPKVIRNNKSPHAQLEDMFTRWNQRIAESGGGYAEENMTELASLRRALAIVNRDWKLLRQGESVPFMPDVFPRFPWRDRSSKKIQCTMETMALYDDKNNTLLINKDIYNKLSNTDRAALRVHEAVYKLKRMYKKETTTEETRVVVASLFSEDDPKESLSSKFPTLVEYFNNQREYEEGASLNSIGMLLGNKKLTCLAKDNPAQTVSFELLPSKGYYEYILSVDSSPNFWPRDQSIEDISEGETFQRERIYRKGTNEHDDFLVIQGYLDYDEGDIHILTRIRMPFDTALSDEDFQSGNPFDAGTVSLVDENDSEKVGPPKEIHPLSCRFDNRSVEKK